jgi:hypothetical protein
MLDGDGASVFCQGRRRYGLVQGRFSSLVNLRACRLGNVVPFAITPCCFKYSNDLGEDRDELCIEADLDGFVRLAVRGANEATAVGRCSTCDSIA